MSSRISLLPSVICVVIVTVLSGTASGADEIRQRTYGNCSPAVAGSGNVILHCDGAERRVSVPSFTDDLSHVNNMDLLSGITLDHFVKFLSSNLGHIVFISIQFSDGDVDFWRLWKNRHDLILNYRPEGLWDTPCDEWLRTRSIDDVKGYLVSARGGHLA